MGGVFPKTDGVVARRCKLIEPTPSAPDRAGPGGVEGAAVGGRGAGGLGSGTGAQLRQGRGGLRGVAPEGGDVGPRQRHLSPF